MESAPSVLDHFGVGLRESERSEPFAGEGVMIKIEILNEDGLVRELIESVHVCIGDPDTCRDAAFCEDCGHEATPQNPVYVWDSCGFNYFACGGCVGAGRYARFYLEVGQRVKIFTYDHRASYRGTIRELLASGKVLVRDDKLGEDHETIRAVVRPI